MLERYFRFRIIDKSQYLLPHTYVRKSTLYIIVYVAFAGHSAFLYSVSYVRTTQLNADETAFMRGTLGFSMLCAYILYLRCTTEQGQRNAYERTCIKYSTEWLVVAPQATRVWSKKPSEFSLTPHARRRTTISQLSTPCSQSRCNERQMNVYTHAEE